MTSFDISPVLIPMNVNLTPELETFVKAKVSTGLYNSASEVVPGALRLLEEQDRIKALKVQLLREEIKKRLDELKRRAREQAGAAG